MIKINRRRVDCPSSLNTSNKALVESDYAQNDVLDALLEMQHFKCCYCEKDLPSVGRSAMWVEHFVARTDDSFIDANGNTNWNEANAWDNLLYTCSTCNRSKGTTHPFGSNNRRRLIDPSYCRIDPEIHIDFIIDDEVIFYKERTNLGKNTIENLKLKVRKDIYSALRIRKVEIDGDFAKLVNALIDGNTVKANSKLADLKKMTSAHQPHASFCRSYIIQKVSKFNNNHLQTINQHLGTQISPITVDVANGYQVIN